MTFQVGDVVKLKSGGEAMTIDEISDGEAYCVWFNHKKDVQRDSFSTHIIQKFEPPKGFVVS